MGTIDKARRSKALERTPSVKQRKTNWLKQQEEDRKEIEYWQRLALELSELRKT